MLTIKNIDKVINMTCYGRDIYHVTTHTNKVGQESYVFEFDLIDSGDGGWNKPQDVHLVRNEYNGTYGLFTMGLQLATERRIEISEVKCLTSLLVEISEVLRKTKYWWEHSNLQNK
jgi:hypothetical protein